MHENGTEKKNISKNMHFNKTIFHLVEVNPCAIDPCNINSFFSNSSRLFLTIIRFFPFTDDSKWAKGLSIPRVNDSTMEHHDISQRSAVLPCKAMAPSSCYGGG